MSTNDKKRVAVLHGAGYTGGELIRLLLSHPDVSLEAVTSRTFADQPVWVAHAKLRGQSDLVFTDPEQLDVAALDAVLIAAEHGKGVHTVQHHLLGEGFRGCIVDLSADFRFSDPAHYDKWFGYTHPAPELLDHFAYGLVERFAPYPEGTRYIANPGCFASAIGLALWPIAHHLPDVHASVTALTGASGSGAKPKSTTHFPTRDGNVRAYKVFAHQHSPEIAHTIGPNASFSFAPVSGPWTRGIWGTAHFSVPAGVDENAIAGWFEDAYGDSPFIRCWPGQLPELRNAVNTPFCDIGWIVDGSQGVVGFAIDNLLKGAASQAIQNLNLVLGLPETAGLLPQSSEALSPA